MTVENDQRLQSRSFDAQVWVRDGVSSARLIWLQWLATLPALLWGCYTTGRQLFAAQINTNMPPLSGWRSALLGVQPADDTHSVWSCWWYGALYLLPMLGLVTMTALVWVHLSAHWRGRKVTTDFWLYALWLTLLCVPTLPLPWVFTASVFMLGVREYLVVDGRYRVQPVAAGYLLLLVMLQGFASDSGGTGLITAARVQGYAAIEDHYSLWQSWLGLLPAPSAGAVSLVLLFGGICLLLLGITQRQRLVTALLGFVVIVPVCTWLASEKLLPETPIQSVSWYWQLSLGNMVFSLFFLASDPACASSTRAGAWCSGLIIGITAALLRLFSPVAEYSWLIAVVLGSGLAPWLDGIVVRLASQREIFKRGLAHG